MSGDWGRSSEGRFISSLSFLSLLMGGEDLVCCVFVFVVSDGDGDEEMSRQVTRVRRFADGRNSLWNVWRRHDAYEMRLLGHFMLFEVQLGAEGFLLKLE